MRIGLGIAALLLGSVASLAAAAPPAPQTVQAIMDTVIDPSADSLWQAAGTEVTAKGSRARRPRTPKQWDGARLLALKIVQGAKLLQRPRPVGADGHWALADASTPGIRTAVQIQGDIARDPKQFYAPASTMATR